MTKTVIDSSAMLAALHGEPRGDGLSARGRSLLIAAPSYGEVVYQAASRGAPLEAAVAVIDRLGIEVHPVDSTQAIAVAILRSRWAGRELPADAWYALALAGRLGCYAFTADPRLRDIETGTPVEWLR